MTSASRNGSGALLPIQVAALFQEHKSGEILWGGFRGEPIVTAYDPMTQTGGAVFLSGNRLEADFKMFWDAVSRTFPASAIPGLQIKFITARSDEATLTLIARKHLITPIAVAAFDKAERLDCFFYPDSGRLRIAPSESEAAAPPHETPFELPRAEEHGRKRRVLIVDDSPTMRMMLKRIISSSPELEVVGEAERPSQVGAMLDALNPDVMTLDINMPEMSGVELLKRILAKRFIPTVMISSLNIDEGHEVLTALELGAVDYIHKPAANEVAAFTPVIHDKLVAASRVRKHKSARKAARPRSVISAPVVSFEKTALIAIGASTGGTEAIRQVFLGFPEKVPPIVVVQHIPPYFSTAFANRLNELCRFEVKEAKDGDEIKAGRALIAPGGLHLEVKKEGARLIARVFDGEPVNRFKPSVDVLFNSVAKTLGARATGILLTGMGSDGARGLLAMKNAGALTIAQDEDSCVVYGMPRAAAELGAAQLVLPLEDIAETLMAPKLAA